MSTASATSAFESYQLPRILIVDDNPRIHRDFEMVLLGEQPDFELEADEQRVYGHRASLSPREPPCILEHAQSGLEALEKVKESLAASRFFQVAFVDVRMPHLDGVATIERMWQLDPNIQTVICTAYADYSREDLLRKLGRTDKLLVLKKPFDSIEVTQLARTLTEKWYLARQAALKLEEMELLVSRRTQKVLDLQQRESRRLHELDEMKLRFLSNLTYEFRKPLASILKHFEPTLDNTDVDGREKHMVHRSIMRMLFLVEQLQDCRDFEVGEVKFEPVESDLAMVIRGIVNRLQPIAERQRVKLQFQSNEEQRLAWVDAAKLESVLAKLISQALVFAPENGRVSILAHFGSSSVRIVVEDNGVPIAKEDLPYAFDSFYRPVGRDGAHRERRFVSSYTRKLIELQGGTISVESVGETSSETAAEQPETRFTMLLPLDRPFGQASPLLSGTHLGNGSATHALPSGTLPVESAETRWPVVLIVESEPNVGSHIRKVLGSEFETSEAGDGQTGLRKAREILPDLIIVDFQMPQIDGADFCRTVKADPLTSHIPIILFSNQEDYQLRALEAGADDYITQPLDLSTLKARVENLLESRMKLRVSFGHYLTLQPREMATNRGDAQFLQRAIAVIEQKMSDFEFDVDALARSVAVSRRQLYRKLKAVTDATPKAFIRSVRLKRAAELLVNSDMTVTEVTFAVGFQDVKYFRNLFKEQFGVLPSEYVKMSARPGGPQAT